MRQPGPVSPDSLAPGPSRARPLPAAAVVRPAALAACSLALWELAVRL